MHILASERLHYRLMNLQDAALLHELDQDERVMKYINGAKKPSMQEIEDVMIPRLRQYLNPEKGWGIWQVSCQYNKEYIGWILVRPMDFFSDRPQFDNLEVGWRFKSHTWGKGYATEAAKHIIDNIAAATNVKRFCAIAVQENISSIRIMEKLGMRYVKTFVHKDPLVDAEVVYYEC